MSLNIIAYIIYLTTAYIVTVNVGWICYKNGIHFIYRELDDLPLAEMVNKLLLTGYYLLNLGYASMMIYYWDTTTTILEMINSISFKTGGIIFFLGCMHCINMLFIYLLRKNKTI